MIKYLFTNNDLIGSKLISKASSHEAQTGKETPSHFGILFFGRIVLHSNFANGVHFQPYYFFKKKNDVIRSFRKRGCKMSQTECTLMFDQLVQRAYGAKYDFMAIAYFAWRIILKAALNKKIPNKNKWESKSKWFCNEIFEMVLGEDLSMKTPNDLMFMLEKNDNFDSVDVIK